MITAESEVIATTKGEVLSADLEKVGAALTEYSKVDAGLAELRKTYGAVIYDVKTTAGMDAARKARLAVREPRYRVEEIRKSAKAPLLALGKQIDGEAKRITAALLEIETPIDEQIRAEETRRETERKAKEDAERARVLAIQTKLAKLQSLPDAYTAAADPARVLEIVQYLEGGLTFDYQEFAEQAEVARQTALIALRQTHVEAVERVEREEREAQARREEEERLRQEREQFEREKAEQRRVAEIDQRIRALSGPAHLTATDSPMLIDQVLGQLADAVLTKADYGERLGEAQEARKAGVTRLQALWKAALAHKEEQERLAHQRAEQEELARAQAEREAEIARREREQEAAEAERKWLAEQEAKKETERKAEADRIERERQEREAEQARRRAEIVAQLSKMTAEDIVCWIASELGCEWSIVAARLAEIPREDWLALTHSPDSGAVPESPQ